MEQQYFINYLAKMPPYTNAENLEYLRDKNYGRIITKCLTDNTEPVRANRKWYNQNVAKKLTELNMRTPTTTWFDQCYTVFKIPKRSGGYRTIEAPQDEIKWLCQDYLKMFQNMHILMHDAAHGFVKHRNTKTALERHQKNKSKWFLKMDIKDFFPSCKYTMVLNAVSQIMPTSNANRQHVNAVATALINGLMMACYKERLSQGNPLSPFYANLTMIQSDVLITNYCKTNGLIYTRYADDILISSKINFDFKTVQKEIAAILKKEGFAINIKKTRYGSASGRNWNLGLMLNKDNNVTVGTENKRKMKAMLYNASKKELTQQEKYKINGLLGYYKFIEPEYFQKFEFLI